MVGDKYSEKEERETERERDKVAKMKVMMTEGECREEMR